MLQKVLAVALVVIPAALRAQFTAVNLDFYQNYTQTGVNTVIPGHSVPFFGNSKTPYALDVVAVTQNVSDFANGVLSTCGGGFGCPLTLSKFGTEFSASVDIPDAATLATEFPFGSYTVTLSNPGSASRTIVRTQNLFPAAVPTLAAQTFSALNGLNPAKNFTFNFNGFTADPSSQGSYTFLNIVPINPSGSVVFNDDGNPPGVTSFTVPANTFHPNTTYGWELGYSNTLVTSGADVQAFIAVTDGTFTTGAAVQGGCPSNPLTVLTGPYAFKVAGNISSTNSSGSIAGRFVASAGATANASPIGLLNITETTNFAGTIRRQQVIGGNYQINTDCTGGTLSFYGAQNHDLVHYDFFFVDGRTELELVGTDTGSTFSGSASQI